MEYLYSFFRSDNERHKKWFIIVVHRFFVEIIFWYYIHIMFNPSKIKNSILRIGGNSSLGSLFLYFVKIWNVFSAIFMLSFTLIVYSNPLKWNIYLLFNVELSKLSKSRLIFLKLGDKFTSMAYNRQHSFMPN